jgi:hypothetical protein
VVAVLMEEMLRVLFQSAIDVFGLLLPQKERGARAAQEQRRADDKSGPERELGSKRKVSDFYGASSRRA